MNQRKWNANKNMVDHAVESVVSAQSNGKWSSKYICKTVYPEMFAVEYFDAGSAPPRRPRPRRSSARLGGPPRSPSSGSGPGATCCPARPHPARGRRQARRGCPHGRGEALRSVRLIIFVKNNGGFWRNRTSKSPRLRKQMLPGNSLLQHVRNPLARMPVSVGVRSMAHRLVLGLIGEQTAELAVDDVLLGADEL